MIMRMMRLLMKFRLEDAKHRRITQFIAKKDGEKERNQMLYYIDLITLD